jgi:SAM-dependent methyltransferase
MSSVRDHYDQVLATHYSRMFGDFDAKVAEQGALLERLGVAARRDAAMAVDLGAGSGFQSVALAHLGFRVLAIDFSEGLLAELRDRARDLPVEAIAGDIRDVARLVPTAVELVVCMGDTLSHLESDNDLGSVFDGTAARLAPGGRFVLTFRDLSRELRDLDRIIPLHASDELVMTCFVEYEPSTVKVHDLIWIRHQDGWRLSKGVYRKLRLAPDAVIARLQRAGFAVDRHEAPSGMVALVGVLTRSRGS